MAHTHELIGGQSRIVRFHVVNERVAVGTYLNWMDPNHFFGSVLGGSSVEAHTHELVGCHVSKVRRVEVPGTAGTSATGTPRGGPPHGAGPVGGRGSTEAGEGLEGDGGNRGRKAHQGCTARRHRPKGQGRGVGTVLAVRHLFPHVTLQLLGGGLLLGSQVLKPLPRRIRCHTVLTAELGVVLEDGDRAEDGGGGERTAQGGARAADGAGGGGGGEAVVVVVAEAGEGEGGGDGREAALDGLDEGGRLPALEGLLAAGLAGGQALAAALHLGSSRRGLNREREPGRETNNCMGALLLVLLLLTLQKQGKRWRLGGGNTGNRGRKHRKHNGPKGRKHRKQGVETAETG